MNTGAPAISASAAARAVASASCAGRPGQRVELRRGVPAAERVGHEHVDGGAVLGVDHHEAAQLARLPQRPEDCPIVGHQPAGIRHEHLERRDALAAGEFAHLGPGLRAALPHHHVEAVVDDGLPFSLRHPGVERGAQAFAGLRCGEVDDRGGAAVGRGDGPGLEVVGGGDVPCRHVQVRVRVDAAGHHEATRGVDYRVGLRRQSLPEARDDAFVDVDVGGDAPCVRENGAVADERRGHWQPCG